MDHEGPASRPLVAAVELLSNSSRHTDARIDPHQASPPQRPRARSDPTSSPRIDLAHMHHMRNPARAQTPPRRMQGAEGAPTRQRSKPAPIPPPLEAKP